MTMKSSTPMPYPLPRAAQDFAALHMSLGSEHWPPRPEDVRGIAACWLLTIAELDTWETKTGGQDVVDVHQGAITTAQGRRIMAREVHVGGDAIVVTLAPRHDRCVGVELRARTEGHLLRDPELVMAWTVDGYEYGHHVALKPKGPQWYMLAQLRDDLLEGRLGAG